MDDCDFFRVLADGFGVPADSVDLVLVDTLRQQGVDSGMRVGMLARLLASGEDWQVVASATGFAIDAQPASGRAGRVLVEVGHKRLPLDVFAVAADPLAAVTRMFQDEGV